MYQRFQPWEVKGGCCTHEHLPGEKMKKMCAAKLAQRQGNPVHYCAQNYRRLGCQKSKNGQETTEKRQRNALKD